MSMYVNNRTRIGTYTSIFGILSNLIISLFKIIVGFISNTISIVADGINNLSDSLTSIISLFGFKMGNKKPDKKHPYGHKRIEYICSFVISLIICILGFELIIESIKQINNKEVNTSYFTLNIIILVVAIIVKIIQAIIYKKVGKKINSKSLENNSIDSRNDVISSLVVLFCLILSNYLNYNINSYCSIIVGLFIVYSGIKLIYESSTPLIGEKPSKELVLKLEQLIKSNEVVLGIHDLEIHSYGEGVIYSTCHVEVDSKGNLLVLHDEIDQIEHKVKKELNIHLTIHLDPILVGDELTDKLKSMTLKILNENLDFKYKIHDFRIVSGVTHTNIIFDIVIPYGLKKTEEQIEDLISALIKKEDEKFFTVVNIDYDLNDELI